MLVAVRAIAPVAGKPPTSGEATLAMPCAISSTLGLWRSPLMRSETTADISDSIAPSMATVIAGEISGRMRWNCKGGIAKLGRPEGIPPKRVPIVSIGNLSNADTTVPVKRATIYPGTRFR